LTLVAPRSKPQGVLCVGRVVHEVSEFVDQGTNNWAEHWAVTWALECAFEKGYSRLLAKSDSQLVINQLTGRWAVNDARLAELVQRTRLAASRLESVAFQWIRREENAHADRLSKLALLKDPSPHFIALKIVASGSDFTAAISYVKSLGGRFDPDSKAWWVPRERLANITADERRAHGLRVEANGGAL
jgi:ribonuclease HI